MENFIKECNTKNIKVKEDIYSDCLVFNSAIKVNVEKKEIILMDKKKKIKYFNFNDFLKNRIIQYCYDKVDTFPSFACLEEEVTAENYHWKLNKEKISEDHLYFLIHKETIKIGRSKNIENRIKQLKTGLSDKFEVYFISNKGVLESTLHNCFSDFRLKGEWFTKNDRILKFINKNSLTFIFSKKEAILEFGKYKGFTHKEVIEKEPSYIHWLENLKINSSNKKQKRNVELFLSSGL